MFRTRAAEQHTKPAFAEHFDGVTRRPPKTVGTRHHAQQEDDLGTSRGGSDRSSGASTAHSAMKNSDSAPPYGMGTIFHREASIRPARN